MAGGSAKDQRQRRAEQMRRERERADKRRRNIITLAVVAVVLVIVAVAVVAIVTEVGRGDDPAAAPANVTDDFGVVYDARAAGATAVGTPVEVVVYEDFQCPFCRAFQEASGSFLDQQVEAGALSVEYRPLAFLDSQSTDEYSTRSAAAAACVIDEAGGAGFHRLQALLYDDQPAEGGPGLTDDRLAGLAEQAAGTPVAGCIDDGTYDGWVEDASQAARDDDIGATPTVLVAGEPVTNAAGGFPSPDDLQRAIAATR